MSDYLWDRSGEPDAEVQRLEELLGNLRYEPRRLELPEIREPALLRRIIMRPAFAAAAALVLLALAGGWLVMLRHKHSALTPPEVARGEASPGRTVERNTSRAAGTTGRDREQKADAMAGPVKQEVIARNPQAEKVYRRATERHRDRRRNSDLDGVRGPAQVASGNRSRFPLPPDMIEAQEAKGQLMLALQVVSDKLSLVRRKAPGITGLSATPDQHY